MFFLQWRDLTEDIYIDVRSEDLTLLKASTEHHVLGTKLIVSGNYCGTWDIRQVHHSVW